MIIALEGSSPTIAGENNYKYYVWDYYLKSVQSPKIYEPGPATFSMGGSDINIRKMANKATAFINQNQGKIFLIGWSRGAAACIQTAHDLNASGKQVDAMFLFDAVDRDTSTSSNLNYIPGNVVSAYHAIATGKNWFWGAIFSTCGKTAAPGVNLVKKEFNVSHGAIAGTENNDGGSKDWMEVFLKSEGVI
jgi:pimeloyl-ACP methyl ester carboxylesterase